MPEPSSPPRGPVAGRHAPGSCAARSPPGPDALPPSSRVPATRGRMSRAARGSAARHPDLSGDWRLDEVASSDNCPPSIAQPGPAPPFLYIAQNGRILSACLTPNVSPEAATTAHGPVTESGFLLDTGGICLGGSGPNGCCAGCSAYARTIATSSPIERDMFPVTEEWQIKAYTSPPRPAICARSAMAVMTRVSRSVACRSHADCLKTDGCGRCVGGVCTRSPLCQ
jgi:hypothetical protein